MEITPLPCALEFLEELVEQYSSKGLRKHQERGEGGQDVISGVVSTFLEVGHVAASEAPVVGRAGV